MFATPWAQDFWVSTNAFVADDDSCSTNADITIVKIVVGFAARLTCSEHDRVVGEVELQSLVEDIQRTFPVAIVLERLSVSSDASVNLIHLLKTAILHDDRENFAANSACAICDDGFVLQVIEFAALQFPDKVRRGSDVGNHCILEAANTCLELVASVEKNNVVSFFHQAVDFTGAEMSAAANYSGFGHNNLVGNTERDNFISHTNGQAWKVIADTV